MSLWGHLAITWDCDPTTETPTGENVALFKSFVIQFSLLLQNAAGNQTKSIKVTLKLSSANSAQPSWAAKPRQSNQIYSLGAMVNIFYFCLQPTNVSGDQFSTSVTALKPPQWIAAFQHFHLPWKILLQHILPAHPSALRRGTKLKLSNSNLSLPFLPLRDCLQVSFQQVMSAQDPGKFLPKSPCCCCCCLFLPQDPSWKVADEVPKGSH